jgi:hypothetical protein
LKAKSQIIRSEQINRGTDRADIVRGSGPDGTVAVFAINRTQRMADRLYDQRRINPRQYDAATQLRDLWERAGICVANLSAADLHRISGGEQEWIADDAAFHRYMLAMKQMGRDGRRILFDVVIGDVHPDAWGRRFRCQGLLMLQGQLDRLARWWGV